MQHLNYNHLYYFWMVKRKRCVAKAAEALCLTPQTITGQMRLLENRLKGSLFKRVGRNLEATELDMRNVVGAGAFETPYRW